jgi:sulfoxide reductase catalytic subunit YedY
MEHKLHHLAVKSSEITPEKTYFSRRDFLKAMGLIGASAALGACAPRLSAGDASTTETGAGASDLASYQDEFGDPANSFDDITHYNNFYEYSENKEAVAPLSQNFKSTPWAVEVAGLVQRPKIFALEDLLRFEQKERVYRLRCVEGWSMVIPWTGFELADLIEAAGPLASAKYAAFTTLFDPDRFRMQASPMYPWPYTEGLRLDEALHRLTILATGLYGRSLPNANGAPLRLVVPWKYGFKSIKAIVKIELTEKQPPTFWHTVSVRDYGFYSNVNPTIQHPRWTQQSERRIGELSRRDTLMFNGYADEVASLYTGMDLNVNY